MLVIEKVIHYLYSKIKLTITEENGIKVIHNILNLKCEMQSLIFLGQYKSPTSIQLRICETFWVDEYIRDILQSKINRIVNIIAPVMARNPTMSDPMSGPGHEKNY